MELVEFYNDVLAIHTENPNEFICCSEYSPGSEYLGKRIAYKKKIYEVCLFSRRIVLDKRFEVLHTFSEREIKFLKANLIFDDIPVIKELPEDLKKFYNLQ